MIKRIIWFWKRKRLSCDGSGRIYVIAEMACAYDGDVGKVKQ